MAYQAGDYQVRGRPHDTDRIGQLVSPLADVRQRLPAPRARLMLD
jgi:hypothetical protein